MSNNFLKGLGAFVVSFGILLIWALVIGWLVMLIWNWIVPTIFGLPTIDYIQGFGLMLLSGLLIKGSPTVNSKDK